MSGRHLQIPCLSSLSLPSVRLCALPCILLIPRHGPCIPDCHQLLKPQQLQDVQAIDLPIQPVQPHLFTVFAVRECILSQYQQYLQTSGLCCGFSLTQRSTS